MQVKGFVIGAICGAALTAWWMRDTTPPAAAAAPTAASAALQAASPAPQLAAQRAASVVAAASTPVAVPPPTPSPPPNLPPLAPLSSDHQALLKPADADVLRPPTPDELNERMRYEAQDPAWSPRLEALIRSFLAEQAPSPQFEIMDVSCRSSTCRIALFVNGDDAPQRMQKLEGQLMQQPWWGAEFRGTSATSSARNGRTMYLGFATRKAR